MTTKFKKIVSITLFLMIMLVTVPVSASSASEKTADGFKYIPLSGTTAKITGAVKVSETLNIPSKLGGYTITEICEKAFYHYGDLDKLTLPNTLKKIGKKAFQDCWIEKGLVIPDSVVEIGTHAFDFGVNGDLKLGKNLEKIGAYAFGFSVIKSVVIPDKVKNLDYVFSDSSIDHLTLGKNSNLSEKGIKELISDGFSVIKQIDVPKENPNFTTKDGVLFNKGMTKLILFPSSKQTEKYEIPQTVTELYKNSFPSAKIDTIVFSDNLKKYNAAFSGNNIKTFMLGKNTPKPENIHDTFVLYGVESINVPEGNPYMDSVDGVLYDDGAKKLLMYPYNKAGKTYNMPNTVTSIGEFALALTKNLNYINFSDSLKTIGENAFRTNRSIVELTLPDSLRTIEKEAFFASPIAITLNNGLEKIGARAFKFCSKFKTLTIPNSVKEVGNCAFDYCMNLESLKVENPATILRHGAFADCSNLKSARISYACGGHTFARCTSLKNVEIPEGVELLGKTEFFRDELGGSITIPATVKKINAKCVGFDGYKKSGKTIYTKFKGFKIKGYKGTAAESYAKKYGFKFVALD